MSEVAAPGWCNQQVVACLALTLLLHALLLLIPVRKAAQQPLASSLVVRLTPAPVQQPAALPDPVPRRENQAEQLPEQAPFPEPDPIVLPVTPEPLAAAEEDDKTDLSAATLIRSVQDLEMTRRDAPSSRKLGIHQHQDPPANWKPGSGAEALHTEANRFSESYAPAKLEIVDRWLAADGSHNVVVNLPNGETLCGRAEAWNPMQPLVEHVMMFRTCGGGGKRTFDMKIPETAGKDFLR